MKRTSQSILILYLGPTLCKGIFFKVQTTWDYFNVWQMSWYNKLVTHNALCPQVLGIVPKGMWEVGETLHIARDVLVRGWILVYVSRGGEREINDCTYPFLRTGGRGGKRGRAVLNGRGRIPCWCVNRGSE
jgi:hypothetical protein